jgi:hypothetical protein
MNIFDGLGVKSERKSRFLRFQAVDFYDRVAPEENKLNDIF